jgi:hypothetical protein
MANDGHMITKNLIRRTSPKQHTTHSSEANYYRGTGNEKRFALEMTTSDKDTAAAQHPAHHAHANQTTTPSTQSPRLANY